MIMKILEQSESGVNNVCDGAETFNHLFQVVILLRVMGCHEYREQGVTPFAAKTSLTEPEWLLRSIYKKSDFSLTWRFSFRNILRTF